MEIVCESLLSTVDVIVDLIAWVTKLLTETVKFVIHCFLPLGLLQLPHILQLVLFADIAETFYSLTV